jgi:SAM-dependent MidA family methyltransferase
VEVQLAAADWIGTALSAVAAGSVVVIDYGGTGRELTGRRKEGTLRTYQRHHLGPDPLAAPGETDLTVDVDFSALASAAKAAGAGSTTVSRQDEFLRSLGLDEVVDDLRHRELDLARDGDPIERLQVRSQRTGAETLLHPRGLGDFRVLRVEV